MPCTYHESAEEKKAAQDKANAQLIAPWKAQLNLTTRLLCEIMTLYTENGLDGCELVIEHLFSDKDLNKWWAEHKAADAKKAKSRK